MNTTTNKKTNNKKTTLQTKTVEPENKNISGSAVFDNVKSIDILEELTSNEKPVEENKTEKPVEKVEVKKENKIEPVKTDKEITKEIDKIKKTFTIGKRVMIKNDPTRRIYTIIDYVGSDKKTKNVILKIKSFTGVRNILNMSSSQLIEA